jgi:thiol:disulfide interchange protein
MALSMCGALFALGGRQRRGQSSLAPAISAIVIVASALMALPSLVRAPTAEAQGVLPSQPFSATALAKAQADGKPVFVWFTADWCLTCKVNESVAIEREATRAAFAKAGVVAMRGDWTRRDPAITRFLTDHGVAGVPLYLWYAPGKGDEVLPQVLTPDMLVSRATAS